MNKFVPIILGLSCLITSVPDAAAQFGAPLEFGTSSQGDVVRERTQLWRVGVRIAANSGPCTGIFGTFSVPVDWPEQDVKIADEAISETVSHADFRNLKSHVRQMVFTVPRLDAGEQAEVLVTYEVTRRIKPLPPDTSVLRMPTAMPTEVRLCLASGPYIESRNTKIRLKLRELTSDKELAWDKVAAIYDWIKGNISHTNDGLKGAVETLDAGKGTHEDLAGLFIALCRAAKVPARIVWVPNYCYAEFYLEDSDGQGEWFPCEFKEKTELGTVSEPYVILQKGENVQVPGLQERKRYVGEYLKAKPPYKPSVDFVRDSLGNK